MRGSQNENLSVPNLEDVKNDGALSNKYKNFLKLNTNENQRNTPTGLFQSRDGSINFMQYSSMTNTNRAPALGVNEFPA